mgnify:CR=1 FL=1
MTLIIKKPAGAFDKTIKSIEVGIMGDVFIKKIPNGKCISDFIIKAKLSKYS